MVQFVGWGKKNINYHSGQEWLPNYVNEKKKYDFQIEYTNISYQEVLGQKEKIKNDDWPLGFRKV